jgi:hypothetical protein
MNNSSSCGPPRNRSTPRPTTHHADQPSRTKKKSPRKTILVRRAETMKMNVITAQKTNQRESWGRAGRFSCRLSSRDVMNSGDHGDSRHHCTERSRWRTDKCDQRRHDGSRYGFHPPSEVLCDALTRGLEVADRKGEASVCSEYDAREGVPDDPVGFKRQGFARWWPKNVTGHLTIP